MKSILQDLYRGNLRPAEHGCTVSEALRQQREKRDVSYNALAKKLTPELARELETVIEEHTATTYFEVESVF